MRSEKTKSCSTLWFDECYDDYYRNSSEKFENDFCDYSANRSENKNGQLRQFNNSDEHRIRIKVNYDENGKQSANLSDTDHSSVSCVEINGIDNDHDSLPIDYEDQVSAINIESDSSICSKSLTFESNSSTTDYSGSSVSSSNKSAVNSDIVGRAKQLYNEKAIDVPAGFEEQVYDRINRHNRSPIKRKICTPIRQLNPISSDYLEVSGNIFVLIAIEIESGSFNFPISR